MVWEVVEINFRFELLGLDARASGLDRPDECQQCFPGNVLVGFDIGESKLGFAAVLTRIENGFRIPSSGCAAIKPRGVTQCQSQGSVPPLTSESLMC
jgi:hypothetical protein